MKISPRLAIIASLLLAYAAFLTPSTYVRYRLVDTSTLQAPATSLASEGSGYAYGISRGDVGVATAPCDLARFAWSSEPLHWGFIAWQILAFGLGLVPLRNVFLYAVQHKVPLPLYSLVLVALAFIPIAWLVWGHEPEARPICDFRQYFEITTFAPNWLFFALWIPSMIFGYRASTKGTEQIPAPVRTAS